MMRIKKLKICGFRGFNLPQEIDLDYDLIIVSGENHSGKTSMAEALEWLFFGYTNRCRRGKEKYSKSEYKGSYRNVHYTGDELPHVEIEATHNGNEVTLRRDLTGDEDSRSYLDNLKVEDFGSVGFSSTASHPVVAQHGLRDFIYTNPNDRREILSYILGLETLITLEGDIQETHTEYKRQKPTEYETFERLLKEANDLNILQDVFISLQTSQIQEARNIFIHTIRDLLNNPDLSEEKIPEALSHHRAYTQTKILDLNNYQEEISDLSEEYLETNCNNLISLFSAMINNLSSFTSMHSDSKNLLHIQFIQLGLQLLKESDHPNVCPFCGEQTFKDKQKEAYTKLIKDYEDPNIAPDKLKNDLNELTIKWDDIVAGIKNTIPLLPQNNDLKVITKLLAGTNELAQFEEKRIALLEQIVALDTLSNEAKSDIKIAQQILKGISFDNDFYKRFLELPVILSKSVSTLLNSRISYVNQFRKIQPLLENKITSTEKVRAILLHQDTWNRWEEIIKAIRYQELEAKIRSMQSQLKSFIANKQKLRLKEKEKEIISWYELLNPEEDISFKGISVTQRTLKLIGQSYGKELNAAPHFSQSQINCLGLAVYIIKALSSGDLGFIALDDPVQSMDEAHSERLKIKVVNKLLDTKHQVFLFTHLESFANNLQLTYENHNPLRIEFCEYSQNGPNIEIKPPTLQFYLQQARDFSSGSAERRRHSSIYLRLATERIIKLLYNQATGSLPKKYQGATFSELRDKALPKCDQLSPNETTGIKATYKFVVKYPHDDMTVEPPGQKQLEPHISRLIEIATKHNLQN